MGARVPYEIQLIQQARHLAEKDPTRPYQASLRRAVSGAYYALFHCLVSEVTRTLLGQSPGAESRRHVMARAFAHVEMADASKSFSRAASRGVVELHDGLRRCIPEASIHWGVAEMCTAFVELQEARHKADYDLSQNFRRHECLELVQRAEDAITAWRGAIAHSSASAYTLSLLLWRRMRKD